MKRLVLIAVIVSGLGAVTSSAHAWDINGYIMFAFV
jgi:hypothetical protein